MQSHILLATRVLEANQAYTSEIAHYIASFTCPLQLTDWIGAELVAVPSCDMNSFGEYALVDYPNVHLLYHNGTRIMKIDCSYAILTQNYVIWINEKKLWCRRLDGVNVQRIPTNGFCHHLESGKLGDMWYVHIGKHCVVYDKTRAVYRTPWFNRLSTFRGSTLITNDRYNLYAYNVARRRSSQEPLPFHEEISALTNGLYVFWGGCATHKGKVYIKHFDGDWIELNIVSKPGYHRVYCDGYDIYMIAGDGEWFKVQRKTRTMETRLGWKSKKRDE